MALRPSSGRATSAGSDDTIQRKRHKKNPMTISSLLSDSKDSFAPYSQFQKPINSNYLTVVEPDSVVQSPRDRNMSEMTSSAPLRPGTEQARVARELRTAKVLPQNEIIRDRCSELQSNGGETHDKWGDRIADWVDEDALYTNVATPGPSDGEDDSLPDHMMHSTKRLQIDYNFNIRTYGVPDTCPYPGERCSKEDICPLSPLPYLRSPSQPHTARSASVVSIRSYVSGASVPPSPYDECASSASEASYSRRGSAQEWASECSPCITPSVIGREREDPTASARFIPPEWPSAGSKLVESKRSTREEHDNDTERCVEGRGRPESPSSNHDAQPVSYTYPPVTKDIDARNMSKGSTLTNLPSSPEDSLPTKLTGRRRRACSPQPDIGNGPQGGDAEYECRIGDCGLRLKTRLDVTKGHILDYHWAKYKLRDADGVCRKILCGWPDCAYGSIEKGGITLSVYARHVVSVHVENPGLFICPQCKLRCYTRRDAMVRHMRKSCMKCEKCHVKIEPVEAYVEHLIQVERGWKCRYGGPPIGDDDSRSGVQLRSVGTDETRDNRIAKGKEVKQVQGMVKVMEDVDSVHEGDEDDIDEYRSEEGGCGGEESEYESEEGDCEEGEVREEGVKISGNVNNPYRDDELEDGELCDE